MSVSVYLFKFHLLVLVFCSGTSLRAQSPSSLPSLQGKSYLSPRGWYLQFINNRQALFNLDTFAYSITKDTLQLTTTRTWIGEQRHQFEEKHVYRLFVSKNGLQLQPLSLPYGPDQKGEEIVLTDASTLSTGLLPFKKFSITRKTYLTSGGEWDSTGQVRSDTVYTITKATLHNNKKLVTEIGHLRVVHSAEENTTSYAPVSKKTIRLSSAAFRQKSEEIQRSCFSFMKDSPCTTNYLHYRFEYTGDKNTHHYTRCWLNILEVPLAAWVDVVE